MGEFVTKIAESEFGWKPPICFECGQTMEALYVVIDDGQLEQTGKVEFICHKFMEHRSSLSPYVVFEREIGVDRISEWGWKKL